MSLASSLTSALAGLSVSSRRAEVLSNNISNALTPGFARREVLIGTRSLAGGAQTVQVTGLRRDVDPVLLADRRQAQAGSGGLDRRAEFLARFEAAVGTPASANSLTGWITTLDASLIEAVGRPDSETVLGNVVSAARGMIRHIGQAAEAVQAERTAADSRIAASVATLNDGLTAIADANARILALTSAGRDATTQMDERQRLVDGLAAVVPLREVARADGQIALFSTGGAVLLDGRPAKFGFAVSGQIGPEMTLASGSLAGLTLNGDPLRVGGNDGLMAGGSLAADFDIRDRLGIDAQGRLDAVARDLVERMDNPALDPTLAATLPGLFTDKGQKFDSGNEIGLAQRLQINAAVDPAQGGDLWRLRSGLGATTPGPSGDTALLTAMRGALSATRPTGSGGFMAGVRSFATLGSDLMSVVGNARLDADSEASFATARTDALLTLELSRGVDTDRELQELLLVEQAYGANAKVIQTVDDMIKLLLGLGG